MPRAGRPTIATTSLFFEPKVPSASPKAVRPRSADEPSPLDDGQQSDWFDATRFTSRTSSRVDRVDGVTS